MNSLITNVLIDIIIIIDMASDDVISSDVVVDVKMVENEKKYEKVFLMASDVEEDNKEKLINGKNIIMMSTVLAEMIGDLEAFDIPVPLPNVNYDSLIKIANYCEHHAKTNFDADKEYKQKPVDDWNEFDRTFCTSIPIETTVALINASNYLHIVPLLDTLCMYVARQIKGKTPEEMAKYFKSIGAESNVDVAYGGTFDPKNKPQ